MAGAAALPIPRSEMAWATVARGRLHVVGGYGEGAVNRDYHHIYDPRRTAGSTARRCRAAPTTSRWRRTTRASGPSAASSSRTADRHAGLRLRHRYESVDCDRPAAAPARCGGGRAARRPDPSDRRRLRAGAERASVGWHEVYDPKADRWSALKALPGARDHVGCVAHRGRIHVIGGRFNTFEYNTALHYVYIPARDTWEARAPMPTERSGHGLVVYRDRLWAMGGEGGAIVDGVPRQARVYGQMESYDAGSDTWQRHAPMPTPRHAVGAGAIGDWIHVAGGGAVLGGSVQSAVHEAFTLALGARRHLVASARRSCVIRSPFVRIDGHTELIAHLGHPTHSFKAPLIYNPHFEATEINAVVVPMGCRPARLPMCSQFLRARERAGALITMPHKVSVVALLDEVSAVARVAGACNAVRRDAAGRLVGDMFDGEGFVRGVRRKGLVLRRAAALVVGCGGVGSAIAASLAGGGVARLALFDVDRSAEAALASACEFTFRAVTVSTGSNDPVGFDLVVNATRWA
jgi:hypothetical protein